MTEAIHAIQAKQLELWWKSEKAKEGAEISSEVVAKKTTMTEKQRNKDRCRSTLRAKGNETRTIGFNLRDN